MKYEIPKSNLLKYKIIIKLKNYFKYKNIKLIYSTSEIKWDSSSADSPLSESSSDSNVFDWATSASSAKINMFIY